MAEGATVGALRVVLGLDTAKFEEGLKKSSNSVNSFGKQIGAVAIGVQLQKAIEGTARAFVKLATAAIQTGDDLFKASQKLGVPVEQLSVLKHAAELSDVSFEELSKSFVIMSKKMNEAASGQITTATAALTTLGFNLKEFSKLSPEEAFGKIADEFSKMEDGANKTAMAVAIFGRAGAGLIPLLNQGSEGFKKAREEAQAFGLIMSTQAAKSSESFMDNLKRLGSIIQGVAIQVTSHFIPSLDKLSEQMVDWAKNNDVVARASEGLIRGIKLVIDNMHILINLFAIFISAKILSVLVSVSGAFVTLTKAIASASLATTLFNAAVFIALGRFAAIAAIFLFITGKFSDFGDTVSSLGGKLLGMLPDGLVDKVKSGLSSVGISLDGIGQKFSEFGGTAVVDKIKALSKSITDMIPAGAADAVSQALKLIGLNLDALTEDLEQAGAGCLALIDNLGEIPKAAGKSFSAEAVKAGQNFGQAIVKLRTETMELKGSFDHLAPGFVSAAQGLGLVKTEADLTALAAGRLTSQQLLLNQELLKKAGAEAAQAALEPWERHNKQIEHYQMLAANGVISADTLSKAIQKSAETAGVAWNVATAEIAGNLSQGFGEFAKQNKKFAIAAKAAAIAQAVINTYTAATKALTLGPPLGWIAAAATIVAGLGYVAKIQSQEAFATGGSFRVAGGLTGVDSEMVAFSATPGEIVDVRRPGQTALSGGVQVVELKTPRVKDFFTENIRALVDSINAAAPDGYIIRMPAT